MNRKGIFCLEGLWDNDLKKRSSVAPMLSLLDLHSNIPYIYNNCATIEEFEFYLKKWSQRQYRNYPILYLAFHGQEGMICFGNKEYHLKEIGELLEGRCKNRVLVIGSCSVLAMKKPHLKKFLETTGALAVCGYKTEVEWMRATAFELLLLDTLQENSLDGTGISSIAAKLNKLKRSFKDLEFRMVSVKD